MSHQRNWILANVAWSRRVRLIARDFPLPHRHVVIHWRWKLKAERRRWELDHPRRHR